MVYSTSNTLSLQPLLFDTQDFSSCFFRKPTERELEFLILYSEGVSLAEGPGGTREA